MQSRVRAKMSSHQRLIQDPGFRVWANGMLALFWGTTASLALLLGWLGAAAFAIVSFCCAVTLTTGCLVAFLRRRG